MITTELLTVSGDKEYESPSLNATDFARLGAVTPITVGFIVFVAAALGIVCVVALISCAIRKKGAISLPFSANFPVNPDQLSELRQSQCKIQLKPSLDEFSRLKSCGGLCESSDSLPRYHHSYSAVTLLVPPERK